MDISTPRLVLWASCKAALAKRRGMGNRNLLSALRQSDNPPSGIIRKSKYIGANWGKTAIKFTSTLPFLQARH